MLAGLALSVVASLAAIATSSIGALIGARVVQAIGASTGIVIGRAIIRDLFERERAAAMFGLVTTAMVIAPMISPLIGGILDTAFGWEAIFLFLALFSGAVLTWALHGAAGDAAGEPWRTRRACCGRKRAACSAAKSSTATCCAARSVRRRSLRFSAAARMWW